MRVFCLLVFCLAATCITAQSSLYTDSITWALSSNDSVSSSTPILRGKKQNLGSQISEPVYENTYQKISRPAGGWPPVVQLESNQSFLEFPFGTKPDICYDTIGGNRHCIGESYFYPQLITFAAHVSQPGDSITMDVYFIDTSCYARNNQTNYKYLGLIVIKSSNNAFPTNIRFPTVKENDNRSIHVCGPEGKYSAIRFYPKAGSDVFIKNMTISGWSAILLPIQFVYTKAVQKNQTIILDWRISNVPDLLKFVVEKSTDGQVFKSVTIIDAATVSSPTGVYHWTDIAPSADNNFYRVVAIEKSGKITAGSIVKIRSAVASPTISVYPNPTAGRLLNLKINHTVPGEYVAILYNLVGQSVFHTRLKVSGSTSQAIQLPASVQKGTYFLTMENAKNKLRLKVVL